MPEDHRTQFGCHPGANATCKYQCSSNRAYLSDNGNTNNLACINLKPESRKFSGQLQRKSHSDKKRNQKYDKERTCASIVHLFNKISKIKGSLNGACKSADGQKVKILKITY